MALVDWSTGEYAPWTSPTVFDLLPDLSAEERRRLRLQGCLPEREDDIPRFPPGPPYPVPSVGFYDAGVIPTVRHALHHYNARHPGGEFDAVKPLMEDGVHFRDEVWSHINFWARSRSSKKIKRFFAEYRSSCAFCRGYLDILHPSDFVCGNGNKEDWNIQEWFGMLFICRKGETFPFSQE